jgi:hypothetical protein
VIPKMTMIIQNNIQGVGGGGCTKNTPHAHTIFLDKKQEKNNASWGEFFFHPPEELTVQQGLDFMLGHFSKPLFPRKVSTAATNRKQHTVDGKDRAMLYYQAALWEDCRIAGYGVGQTNPDLLFIELDAGSFASKRAFKLALTTTLKNIEKVIGGHPSVLWSGRGFHLIQPIDCPRPLEEIKELAALEPYHTSNRFLQFSERYLSANKSDSGHHPAIRSCMLRIPGSLNSRCKELGLDPEVKIIQRWNKYRPDYRLLIGDFHADLVGKQQHRSHGMSSSSVKCNNIADSEITTPWIERLLQTPIEDYRKHARDLILVPYLVVQRGLTNDQIYNIVMEWADKCGELRRLDPSRHEFAAKVRSRTYEVMQSKIPSMSWSTLEERNPELCKILRQQERKAMITEANRRA